MSTLAHPNRLTRSMPILVACLLFSGGAAMVDRYGVESLSQSHVLDGLLTLLFSLPFWGLGLLCLWQVVRLWREEIVVRRYRFEALGRTRGSRPGRGQYQIWAVDESGVVHKFISPKSIPDWVQFRNRWVRLQHGSETKSLYGMEME